MQTGDFWILQAIALVAMGIVLCGLIVYTMALFDICFTLVKEGTAVAIMRGESFESLIMSWRGHYLNDPHLPGFKPEENEWEVLVCSDKNERRSAYPAGSFWQLPERLGIYWYGLWPFYSLYEYEFEWSESKMNDTTMEEEPWHRKELTHIIYVAAFPYWMHLSAAEDIENIPIDLDYLLTVRVNNPYIALFRVVDWLKRLSADANNAAKVWVGKSKFEEIVRERDGGGDTATSGFVRLIQEINKDLPTNHDEIGSPKGLGVTILASSLQKMAPAGSTREDIAVAMTAKIVAEKKAQATVATADGDAKALRIRTLADSQRELALATAKQGAVELVYRKVASFGQTGLLLQQLEAMQAASGAGARVIWANNPFIGGGVANELDRLGITPSILATAIRNLATQTQGESP